MENFTPISAIMGGLLIGTGAMLTLWTNGRIAGISGILSGAMFPKQQGTLWRLLFIAGLLLGGAVSAIASGGLEVITQASPLMTVIAGLLVGFGTRMGSGCTSGHGICGIARFSQPSFVATGTLCWQDSLQFIWCAMYKENIRADSPPISAFVAIATSGFLFGLGLAISGMTNPAKVVGFLDIAGDWDPSLILVMVAGLGVSVPSFHFILKQKQPLFTKQFFLPTRNDLDGKLITGAALFGVGWGIGGYCPGPALAALVSLNTNVILFCGAMLAGMVIHHFLMEK